MIPNGEQEGWHYLAVKSKQTYFILWKRLYENVLYFVKRICKKYK